MAAIEMKAAEIRQTLAYSTGTSNYYRYWLGGGRFVYTDGAKAMADLCEAHWLLDVVFTSQIATGIKKYRKTGETFQVWTLAQAADYEKTGAWLVICEDGDYNELYRLKIIPYLDFPLDEGMKLFVDKNGDYLVCYLPCED